MKTLSSLLKEVLCGEANKFEITYKAGTFTVKHMGPNEEVVKSGRTLGAVVQKVRNIHYARLQQEAALLEEERLMEVKE